MPQNCILKERRNACPQQTLMRAMIRTLIARGILKFDGAMNVQDYACNPASQIEKQPSASQLQLSSCQPQDDARASGQEGHLL